MFANPWEVTFEQWIASLSDAARRRLQARSRALADEKGLAVLREPGRVAIPLTLTPEVIDPAVEAQRGADARVVLDGVLAAARAILSTGTESPLFSHFGELERESLTRWQEAEDVTIARVDWFLDETGRHHALELNATIPAMQGYSDAAAEAWITAVGEEAGLDAARIADLCRQNGSNAEALRCSVLAHAGFDPLDTSRRPSIALIHRENDSQVFELQSLSARWRAQGHVADCHPQGAVAVDAQGRVTVGGRAYDVLYRHIFARRMDPAGDLARVARRHASQRLFNPINGHLEVKGVLGEASRQVGVGSSADFARIVPWTRVLSTHSDVLPDGTSTDDLSEAIGAAPDGFVVKKSWDYGGKSVLLGPDVHAVEGIEGWRRHIARALDDGPGAWVVQSLVRSPRKRHWVATDDGGSRPEEVFVDASSYTASGGAFVPTGGVVRFARVGIVNIVGGGGVCPLIRAPVAQALWAALQSRPAH